MSASSKKKLRKELAAAQMTEKQLAEQKEAKKLKIYTIGFVALIAVVLCVAIGLMVSQGIANSGIIEKNTTAVQIGDHKLSTADLSYYYVDGINNLYSEWYEYYGNMTSVYVGMMYGLDMSKPLDEQHYDTEGKVTWAEYFADIAIENARANYALYDMAVAENHTLTEEEQSNLDNNIFSVQLNAMMNYGVAEFEDYLHAFYSRGATEESFNEYMTVAALAASYYNAHSETLEYDDAAIRAYDSEHSAEFNSYSYASYLMLYNDFLTGGTTGEDGKTTYSDEENAAALKAAEEAAKSIAAGTYASVEEMEKAISALEAFKEDTITATKQEDVLYSNVNSKFTEWLSDASRKAGDVDVIPYTATTTDDEGNESTVTHGYYVIRFESKNDNTVQLKNVRHILAAFEGGTTDSSTGETTYTEAEKQAAKEAIEKVQKLWEDGEATEESFAALVSENSDDGGSTSNGGLYEDVYPGQMVTAFEDWCFDEARKAGDTGIVETEYGYHFMYFVGDSETNYRDYMVESALHNNDMQEWYDGIVEKVEAKNINISRLPLGLVMQASEA